MATRQVCATLLAVASILAPVLAQQSVPPAPYRILVTSDEGVHAAGLAAVAQVLQAIGNVHVVAPNEPQPGASHRRASDEPIVREDLTIPNGLRAIGLSATPASSVSVAVQHLLPARPDLVVAGVHRGYTLGYDAHESGLVAAAREAAMHGVPALAASLGGGGAPNDLVFAAEEVLGVARRVKQYGIAPLTFLNVNVPPMPPDGYKGYVVTTLAPVGIETYAERADPAGRRAYGRTTRSVMPVAEATDIWAVERGFVSVTPLRVNQTDPSQVETLRSMFK